MSDRTSADSGMRYRRLGRSGLKVSVLSLGSWVTFANQMDTSRARECMQAAWDAGVNFFDNAEAYGGGKAERLMGEVIRDLGWPRHAYVISTKLYWGIHEGVNTRRTLNRKYLLSAIDQSLERLDHDFVDLLFCHRSDPETPLEETVRAMHTIVESGRAHYWGTSEWSADDIRGAWEIAERHHLHKPVMEQPRYHLLHRETVEQGLLRLYEDLGLGLTTWSPLASGLLTGKYLEGIPEGSRASLDGFEWLAERLTDEEANARVRRLGEVAADLGCSLPQLAVGWCAANPHVSTVITGASSPEQVEENMGALEVIDRLTPEVRQRIDEALGVSS